MKIIHKSRKPKQLSIGKLGRLKEAKSLVKRRQRFGFGEWIDDGRDTYKRKYICFTCRKTFRATDKRTSLEKCPQCKGELRGGYQMFKAPRKRDTRSWKQLERRFKK